MDSFSALAFSPLHGEAGWDAGVLAGLGVPESKLPIVAPAGSAVGELGKVGVNVPGRDTGRLDAHPTVVASGIVDALAEQMVAGKLDDGDVLIVLGSTLLVWARLSGWREVSGLWTVPDLFDLSGGGCLVGGASNAGGIFVDWVRRLVGMMPADSVPAGGGGHMIGTSLDSASIPVWAPYPRGERTPLHDPERRAALGGLGLEHGPDAVMRAAYEASGFVVRHHIELAGCEPRRIVATGGGIQVDGWLQAIADCTGLPVDVASIPEGAALGAAFIARIACGLERSGALPAGWQQVSRRVEPDSRWVVHCSERYRRFLEMSA
jgi:xylulokinase